MARDPDSESDTSVEREIAPHAPARVAGSRTAMRPIDWLEGALFVTVIATFLLAELARGPSLRATRATILSMVGWGTFAVFFLVWLWKDCGIRAGLITLARLAALTAVGFAVVYAYYERSQLLTAGIEVDATFTFIGLTWFASVQNPITFAGITVSFAQFPMSLFGHFPGYLIGFDRLGPFAIHIAIMWQVAMLLALLTMFVVDRSILVQAATVAALAAVFESRFTVLLCNYTGYAIPSVSIGIMFLMTVMEEQPFSVMAPRVGGLLMLSLMHHYPGVFFVLPLVGLWVLAGRTPWQRLVTFVRANAPLVATVLVLAICVVVHPELLLPRLHVVVPADSTAEGFRAKLGHSWAFLSGPFPTEFVRTFFRESRGSWHLLDIAPLGDLIGPIVVVNWMITGLAMGRRGVAYGARLAVLAMCLVSLTGLMHLVTGSFENYRDMLLLFGLVTPSIGFVLVAPRSRRLARVLLLGYGLAVATYQYVDVAHLVGKRYLVAAYAPEQQAEMESLRRFWTRGADKELRGTILQVVWKGSPLQELYERAAREHGITLQFVSEETFCAYPVAIADTAMATSCGRVAFVVSPTDCSAESDRLGWPPATGAATIYFFDSACNSPTQRDWSTPEVVPLS